MIIYPFERHDDGGDVFRIEYERGDKSLDEKWAKFMALGLGLLYLGEVTICNNSVQLLTTILHRTSGCSSDFSRSLLF
jgi:hypothetical protein